MSPFGGNDGAKSPTRKSNQQGECSVQSVAQSVAQSVV